MYRYTPLTLPHTTRSFTPSLHSHTRRGPSSPPYTPIHDTVLQPLPHPGICSTRNVPYVRDTLGADRVVDYRDPSSLAALEKEGAEGAGTFDIM